MITLDTAMRTRSGTRPQGHGTTDYRKIPWFDTCFTYFTLIVLSSALADPIRVIRGIPVPPPGVSDPVLAVSQSLILGMLICLLAIRPHRILPLLQFIKPYLLLFGICLISSLWSEFPLLTARRSIAFGACLMFGVYCYDVFGLAGLTALISRLAFVLALLSVICFIALPAIGRDPTIGSYNAMRGVFPHKNLLSIFMVLAIVCHAYRIIEQKKVASFVFSVPLLYFSIVLSQSASSLIAATIVVILTGILYLSKRSAAGVLYWYFLTSAIAVFVFVVFLFPDSLFDALGRDASLTGRIPLWGLVAEAIAKQPFFGYGYAGFWNADSRETQYIWSQADWRPPHAHNGYLEVMLEIGVIGLIVVLWLWGRTAPAATPSGRLAVHPEGRWLHSLRSRNRSLVRTVSSLLRYAV